MSPTNAGDHAGNPLRSGAQVDARTRRRQRGLALGLGVAILLWLPFEDTHTGWAQLFALALAGLGAARLITRLPDRVRQAAWLPPLVGALTGLAVPLLALLLMSVKTGAHSHPAPDFTPEHMIALLRLAWLWPLAGLLGGAGLAVVHSARRG